MSSPDSSLWASYKALFPDLQPLALQNGSAAIATIDGRPVMLAQLPATMPQADAADLLTLVANARLPLFLLNVPRHLTSGLETLPVPLIGLPPQPEDRTEYYPLDSQLDKDGCTQQQLSLLLAEFQKLSGTALRDARLARQRKQTSRLAEEVHVRPPREDEVESIQEFFQPYVERNEILPRSNEEIRQGLPMFRVAVNAQNQLVGTVSLRDFGDGLYEVRSLTVRKDYEGIGIGSRLVKGIVQVAFDLGAKRVFTLTMRARLFQRLGFLPVCIMRFPGKVQNDCLRCSKKEHCDEVALLLDSGQWAVGSGQWTVQ